MRTIAIVIATLVLSAAVLFMMMASHDDASASTKSKKCYNYYFDTRNADEETISSGCFKNKKECERALDLNIERYPEGIVIDGCKLSK
jgi:hypothetical protein